MTETILHVSDSYVGRREVEGDGATAGGLASAVERALEHDVDALVHSGNLFRRPNPDDATVEAVAGTLSELAAADVPCFVVAGGREAYGDGEATDRLRAHDGIYGLGAEPTTVGDVALYGVDYADSEDAFLDRLGDLEPAAEFTYNVVIVNQRVWPPLWEETADVAAYDLMEATTVHVDAVLAGGFDEHREWESDDFAYRVTYPGTTNPEKTDAGEHPTGTLVRADSDDAAFERVRLETSDVDAEIAQLRRALEFEPSDVEDADAETLADLYGLAARAKSVFDDRRKELSEELLDRVDDDRRIDGRYASVNRNTRRRRNVRSEETVFETVERAGLDREEVTTLDSSTLRDLVDEGVLEEEDVFDVEQNPYVRVQAVSLEDESD